MSKASVQRISPKLPSLIESYLNGAEQLKAFYAFEPNMSGLKKSAKQRPPVNREVLVKALEQQANRSSYASKKTFAQINRLKEQDVFTVTTGHQVCLYGGPMFFIYKILSAIRLCGMLEAEGVQAVPIYWMASEDHDFEEVNHIFFGETKCTWKNDARGAVGRMKLEGLNAFKSELNEIFKEDPLRRDALEKLDALYSEDKTLAEATRDLVYWMMADLGIVVLDADDAALKACFAPVVKKDLDEQFSAKALKTTTEALEQLGYGAQVNARDINLFWQDEGLRERIVVHGKGFATADGLLTWRKEEMMTLIDKQPERFSPNVVLRPVYQECILPNLAYIGGPGELSYWFQLKQVFDEVGVPFPTLVLRDMALIVPEKIEKRLDQLELGLSDVLNNEFDDLLSSLVRKNGGHEDLVEEPLKEIEARLDAMLVRLKAFDATLAESGRAEKARILRRLSVLAHKVHREDRRKDSTADRRLQDVYKILLPNGIPQERVEHWLTFTEHTSLPAFLEKILNDFNPLKPELKAFKKMC